jgi:hypothetical protein
MKNKASPGSPRTVAQMVKQRNKYFLPLGKGEWRFGAEGV